VLKVRYRPINQSIFACVVGLMKLAAWNNISCYASSGPFSSIYSFTFLLHVTGSGDIRKWML